jgi:hypothetical protein
MVGGIHANGPAALVRPGPAPERSSDARQALKTDESRRAVDIPPPLMRRLLKLVDDRGARFTPNALVFASRNGTGLERKVAREARKRAAKAAKLSDPQPTLHDLRHSHASMLIAMDFSVVDVQRRLGHRKPDITLRIYTHEWKYRDAQRSQIGRQIDRVFRADGPKVLTAAETRDTPHIRFTASDERRKPRREHARPVESSVTCSSRTLSRRAKAVRTASPTPVTCVERDASGRDQSTRRARRDP